MIIELERFSYLDKMSIHDKIDEINRIREELSLYSPFKGEPIDFVKWVKVETVNANDYNPNSVAPPEMELLRHSINHDGYTQPVVTWSNKDVREVIDGFHRTRVCKEFKDVNERVMGYLPVVTIKDDCQERNDRIASTIRHNRARGKHKVESMSDIVLELKKRNWSDEKVARELGMDEDEILRLCQITGLADLFSDADFTNAWDVGIFDESELVIDDDGEVINKEDDRIYHTFDKWECLAYNFYGSSADGLSKDDAEEKYRELLSDVNRFSKILEKIITEWKHSCEHYLTNEKMNRIAWLGQAALAYDLKIPSVFCAGYNRLTEEEKILADHTALEYLNKWLVKNGREPVTDYTSKTKANIY